MAEHNRSATFSMNDRIISALDVDSAENALSIVDEIGDLVGAFKVGLQLFTAAGPELVRRIAKSGHRVFLDLKFHDIPNTVAKAAVEAARMGVWMFNVHALGGSEMMRRALGEMNEVCAKENLARPKMIAVTILTSSDANALIEIGIEREVSDEVLKLAELTSKCGLDGVVASPHEIKAVRSLVISKEFMIVTPGIRQAFADQSDQKRVSTPASAVGSGADYLVIGRPILEANNMRSAVENLVRDVCSVGVS